MNNYIKHIGVIIRHKKEVFKLACIAGIPLRGFLHDFSKFSPIEFFETGKYCNGKVSPILLCKKDKGFSLGWLHHRSHNKHHWEYWVDDLSKGCKGVHIPYKYCVEMGIDIIAANKTYNKDNWEPDLLNEYWETHKDNMILDKRVKEFMDIFFKNFILYGVKSLNKRKLKRIYQKIIFQSDYNYRQINFKKRKYITVKKAID